jgi:aryl-alcohol dehydrogenase-like predicted oxidoreductase
LSNFWAAQVEEWMDGRLRGEGLRQACQHRIPPAEGALRWVCYHSALGEEDGLILGELRLEQVKQNAEAVKKGPLPTGVVTEMEEEWKTLSQLSDSDL